MTVTATADSPYEIAECDSCHARIIWATSAKTLAAMPIDADPRTDGTIRLTERPGLPPLATVLSVEARFGVRRLYVSHFASCPQAASWRRRGSGKRARS